MPHNKIKNAFFDLDVHIYTDAILQPVHPPLILSGGDSYEMYRDKSQKELIPIRNKRQYPGLRTARLLSRAVPCNSGQTGLFLILHFFHCP